MARGRYILYCCLSPERSIALCSLGDGSSVSQTQSTKPGPLPVVRKSSPPLEIRKAVGPCSLFSPRVAATTVPTSVFPSRTSNPPSRKTTTVPAALMAPSKDSALINDCMKSRLPNHWKPTTPGTRATTNKTVANGVHVWGCFHKCTDLVSLSQWMVRSRVVTHGLCFPCLL